MQAIQSPGNLPALRVPTLRLPDSGLLWTLQSIYGEELATSLADFALHVGARCSIRVEEVSGGNQVGWIARKGDDWPTASGPSAEVAVARCEILAMRGPQIHVPGEILKPFIAAAFLDKLKLEIGDENFASCCRLNKAQSDASICHSHDFCDANMVMAAVFTDLTDKEPDVQDDALRQIWNASWDLSKTLMSEAALADADDASDGTLGQQGPKA
jgi:hypothetical protein